MNRRIVALVFGISLASGLFTARPAVAQTAPTVAYPDDNVRSGAIAIRRPGLWIGAASGFFGERQDIMLRGHGGADPQPRESQEFRTQLIVSVLENLFSTLQSLFTGLITSAATTTGTS